MLSSVLLASIVRVALDPGGAAAVVKPPAVAACRYVVVNGGAFASACKRGADTTVPRDTV
jgi:hypothetical protein